MQYPLKNNGNPITFGTIQLSQRVHRLTSPPGSNWEYLGSCTFKDNFDTAVVSLETNGNISGKFIIDAVKFVGVSGTPTAGIELIVDDQSLHLFQFNNWTFRSFMDMQYEIEKNGHTKYSKTPFFLATSCHLHEYTGRMGNAGNNLGLLLAMTQNGLISMGTVNDSYDWSYYHYINTLRDTTKCFGDAFLNMVNNNFNRLDVNYVMFGAGTLRAKAYIPLTPLMSTQVFPSDGDCLPLTQGSKTLKWTSSPNATMYDFSIATNKSMTGAYVISNITDSFVSINTDLFRIGVRYYWRICAINEYGKTYSLTSSFLTVNRVPNSDTVGIIFTFITIITGTFLLSKIKKQYR